MQSQEIEKWITDAKVGGSEPTPEAIETSDTGYHVTQFSNGVDLLRNSEAYKWLVATVQRDYQLRGVEPIRMDDHRNRLLKLLGTPTGILDTKTKISRRRPPPLYTAKLHLDWDLLLFLQEQEYPRDSLPGIVGHVITVTGDSHCVQALSCEEYMTQTWPRMGAEFVKCLDELARGQGENYLCEYMPCFS